MNSLLPFTLTQQADHALQGAPALDSSGVRLLEPDTASDALPLGVDSLGQPRETLMQRRRVDVLAQRLAIHLSQEVWQRLFYGAGRPGIAFTETPLAVLFVESMETDGQRTTQDNFLAAVERLARQHGGTVDNFAWGGSIVFFPSVDAGVRTAVALHRAAPEWQLRMGIHSGDGLVARFRSAGGSHATLLGSHAGQAEAVAAAAVYGSVGLSVQAHAAWLSGGCAEGVVEGEHASAGANASTTFARPCVSAAGPWHCERIGNGSMRLVPTNQRGSAA